MTGFGEHFKNERREKTIALIKNFFGSFFSKKTWYFLAFWGFLFITCYIFYITLTFKNKFPVECGKIVNFEILQNTNGNEYHMFIEISSNNIEDLIVINSVYTKYIELQKTKPDVKYCESYTDKTFIAYCFATALLTIITIVFLCSYSDTY